MKKIKKGDTINFGRYGNEEIAWHVLAVEDDRVLLVSEKAIDAKPYNATFEPVTWETCTLREWLNEIFLKEAFSADERNKIATTIVPADKNPEYNTNPGNDTKDKIFLLSISEVEKYFCSDKSRMCVPTAYAISCGAYESTMYNVFGKGTCWWWLRSPGYDGDSTADVRTGGSVDYGGYRIGLDGHCVRPALWINLES